MSDQPSVFVAVGPGCWGSGPTRQVAVTRALRCAPAAYRPGKHRKPMPYNLYRATPDFEVDGHGTISASKLVRLVSVTYDPDTGHHKEVKHT